MHRLLHIAKQLGCLLFFLIATDSVFFDYPTLPLNSDTTLNSQHVEHHYTYLPSGYHEKPVTGGIPAFCITASSTSGSLYRMKKSFSDIQQMAIIHPLRVHLRI